MQKSRQLSMEFTPKATRQNRTTDCAAKRILKNFRRQQRLVYFSVYAGFKQDRFIALNGVQMF